MENLNLSERLHSRRNKIFLGLRDRIRFSRKGFCEQSIDKAEYSRFLNTLSDFELKEWHRLETKYEFNRFQPYLNCETYKKNIETLFWLDKFVGHLNMNPNSILEPGCQDFNRSPAIASFFASSRSLEIHGIEIDPFPILHDLHSRFDKAQYYSNLANSHQTKAKYSQGNFFDHQEKYELILCFFPFVSPHPALAWGLPAELGQAVLWIRGIQNCLSETGQALIVHQGMWEQDAFDLALKSNSGDLRLQFRSYLEKSISRQQRHPSCVSLYSKS